MERVETKQFLEFIFDGLSEGYICIATINRKKDLDNPKRMTQKFFEYPDELEKAAAYCDKSKERHDVYFAPFLLMQKRRRKVDILETNVAWADSDGVELNSLLLPASAVVASSIVEGKRNFHFYWKFKEPQTPDVGEDISKRIAYYHSDEGMDKSGWDLTQLLRVPNTKNHKYNPPQDVTQAVIFRDHLYTPSDFNEYPTVEAGKGFTTVTEVDIPDQTGQEILVENKAKLNPKAQKLFSQTPADKTWSTALYELECILIEGGLTLEEVFVVCRDAACNKYARDNRNPGDLWKEIQKTASYIASKEEAPPEVENEDAPKLIKPDLLTEEERKQVKEDVTFIEEYAEWAKSLGDAAPQYHPAGAFVILSSLLCGSVFLPTSFGTMYTNMWFMILADTTLTRKSTAMDNATELLFDIDSEILLATDGSIEGLVTTMGARSGKPSLFLRDEITGLVDAITKKEYLAGMMEMFTKMYDGKQMKRILRKETIEVRDPRFVVFAGGIRSKMVDLLNHEHVESGFMPRFVFITAESDTSRLKPIGPPTEEDTEQRDYLYERAVKMYEHYTSGNEPRKKGGKVNSGRKWNAKLDDDAWFLYNTYEQAMLDFAMKSHDPGLMTPMMDRLAKSGLKAAVLIAASRMHEHTIQVTCADLRHAFYYIEHWMDHSIYMIKHIGSSRDEKKLRKVLYEIESRPGVLRSQVMRNQYLSARQTDEVFHTLEQRNLIRREGKGSRGERVYPI